MCKSTVLDLQFFFEIKQMSIGSLFASNVAKQETVAPCFKIYLLLNYTLKINEVLCIQNFVKYT